MLEMFNSPSGYQECGLCQFLQPAATGRKGREGMEEGKGSNVATRTSADFSSDRCTHGH